MGTVQDPSKECYWDCIQIYESTLHDDSNLPLELFSISLRSSQSL